MYKSFKLIYIKVYKVDVYINNFICSVYNNCEFRFL